MFAFGIKYGSIFSLCKFILKKIHKSSKIILHLAKYKLRPAKIIIDCTYFPVTPPKIGGCPFNNNLRVSLIGRQANQQSQMEINYVSITDFTTFKTCSTK